MLPETASRPCWLQHSVCSVFTVHFFFSSLVFNCIFFLNMKTVKFFLQTETLADTYWTHYLSFFIGGKNAGVSGSAVHHVQLFLLASSAGYSPPDTLEMTRTPRLHHVQLVFWFVFHKTCIGFRPLRPALCTRRTLTHANMCKCEYFNADTREHRGSRLYNLFI